MSSSILYPNIAGTPGSSPITRDPVQAPDRPGTGAPASPATGENFNTVLDRESKAAQTQVPGNVPGAGGANTPGISLGGQNVRAPLKFSAHASARVQSRKLDVGPEQMRKLNEAVDRAAAKGLDDTLVLTSDAAFIVSVKNRTIVTAMDRGSLEGNVFTNIEGAVIV